MNNIKYRISPTLLDCFYNYINSDDIWEEYWGSMETPPKTSEQFHEEQFKQLINTINRVPIAWEDSFYADFGTVFNEVIDCMITKHKSDKIKVDYVAPMSPTIQKYELHLEYCDKLIDEQAQCTCAKEREKLMRKYQKANATHLKITYNKREFIFPISVCREFTEYCKGALPQVDIEGFIDTKYGIVLLNGYIDELMPNGDVYDIKTCKRYSIGKFENHFQHKVYPYVLRQLGVKCDNFEYIIMKYNISANNVVTGYETFSEYYPYEKSFEQDIKYWCELLIEFIKKNETLITNKRIYNILTD